MPVPEYIVPEFIVPVAFGVMALSNYLANKKFFGGKDNKELSDTNPTYVTPDGFTFAVWGMIYMMLLVIVIVQCFADKSLDPFWVQKCHLTGLDMRQRLVVAFLLNAVWLPIFNNERFGIAFVVMLLYLAVLVSYWLQAPGLKESGWKVYTSVTAGVAMNTSWIVVASAVSFFVCAGRAGWKDKFGVAGSSVSGGLVVVAVAALAVALAVLRADLAWGFVAAWALRGIYRMQNIPDKVRFPLSALNSTLATLANVCSIVTGLGVVAGLVLLYV